MNSELNKILMKKMSSNSNFIDTNCEKMKNYGAEKQKLQKHKKKRIKNTNYITNLSQPRLHYLPH